MIAAGTALVFAAGAQLTLGYGVKILIDEGFAGPDPSGLYKAVVFMLVVVMDDQVIMYLDHQVVAVYVDQLHQIQTLIEVE